jgi:Flp pilus assembly pilin Flp
MKRFRQVSKLVNKARLLVTFRKLRRNCSGQTLVEYALILAFIVIVSIGVLVSTGTSLRGLYSTISSQVARANTGS